MRLIGHLFTILQVMLCVGGPSSNKGFIDYFADVLLALNKKYFDNLCTFMNVLVKEDGFPTDKVSRCRLILMFSASHMPTFFSRFPLSKSIATPN